MQAHLSKLFCERVDKVCENLPSVVDLLRIFSHDPDQGCPRIRLVELIYTLTQGRYYALIARIFAEDIFDDYDCFLDNVVYLGVDEVKQSVDAFLARAFNLDCDLANGLDSASDEVHINLHSVFFQLSEKLIHILVISYSYHDLQFLHLEIWWIVVLAEEDSHLLAQNVRLLLKEEIDIAKGHILHLGLG